jgi:hypothetical protein
MSGYRPGVLIHNYNEDRFGTELVDKRLKFGRHKDPPYTSISRMAFRDPKVVAAETVRPPLYVHIENGVSGSPGGGGGDGEGKLLSIQGRVAKTGNGRWWLRRL